MKKTLAALCQIAALIVLWRACHWAVVAAGLPVPGNVLGVIALFLLLLSGIVKEEHINEGASFLLRHMVFFFIPIAAGLMDWGGVFYEHALVLTAAIAVSSFLPLLGVGWFIRLLRRDTKR